MELSNINIKEIEKELINLFYVDDIKVSDIDFEKQNNTPYIHFELFLFDESIIDILTTNNVWANDEMDDPEDNKFEDLYGIKHSAIIKGPVKYSYIKLVHKTFGGTPNFLGDEYIYDEDEIFFCIGEKLKDKLKIILNIN